jgi:hypothetical protein
MVIPLTRLADRVRGVGAEVPGGAAQAAAQALTRAAAMLGADVERTATGGNEADAFL